MIIASHFQGKKCAVIGFGRSGFSTIESLLAGGAEIYGWDDNPSAVEAAIASYGDNPHFQIMGYETIPWNDLAALFLAPSIPLRFPKPHPSVLLAKAVNCPIIGDIELFYYRYPEADIVAITGTNGKSTTTALLSHLMGRNKNVQMGGNIGVPVLTLDSPSDESLYVLEVSSYQIDLTDRFVPHIGIFINISPDHLDRHGSMDGYVEAKSQLFRRITPGGRAILGIDYSEVKALMSTLKKNHVDCIPISNKTLHPGGVCVRNGMLSYYEDGAIRKVNLGVLPSLPGQHNGENIAAAFAASRELGLSVDEFLNRLKSFPGLRHRLQKVGELGSVIFVNDSKGTNADASKHALAAFDNIYWLAGGIAKEDGIDPLKPYFSHVKEAFLFGRDRERLAATCNGNVPFQLCDTLADACKKIEEKLRDSQNEKAVILLSPACASFDQWSSFEARGDAFCEWAEGIVHAGSKK